MCTLRETEHCVKEEDDPTQTLIGVMYTMRFST